MSATLLPTLFFTIIASIVSPPSDALVPKSSGESADHSSSGGDCAYNFQVWTPNQDVLQRLRRLEDRCESMGSSVDHQVSLMRLSLGEEMFQALNLTRNVEKTVLEQRLQDAQQNLAMRDLRLEMVDLKGENGKLWEALNRARGSAGGALVKAGGTDSPDIHDQLTSVTSSLTQVKNGVGDLKAEWLLLKREVQFLRSDQTTLRDNSTKLTTTIEALKAEFSRLRTDPSQQRGATLPEELDAGHVRSQLIELRMMTSHLEGELARMRRENAEIRKEIVTSGLATNRNLSREELGRVLDRIAGIQNGSRMRNEIAIPKDCQDVYKNGHRSSGVYQIRPDGAPQLDEAYCEIINGSGWTVIQRRLDGGLSFTRKWLEYKHGFGNRYGEFWAGNEMVHHLTAQREYRLRIDIWDFEGGRVYAEYDVFRVDSEMNKYRLHVRGYRGNSGDSLSYHDDMAFSTEDVDNDLHMRNCALDNKGGWWFNSCFSSNLNGLYHLGRYPDRPTLDTPFADGIVWYTLKETEFYSLKRVEMKVRPVFA